MVVLYPSISYLSSRFCTIDVYKRQPCTPYGINTHRLLVRGRRVDNQEGAKSVRVTADAMLVEPMLVASLAAIPMLLLLLIAMLMTHRRKK